jgi:UDP-glucose 4-epimerase
LVKVLIPYGSYSPEEVNVRVLVTGANGFIGRHVVAAILDRGHEVRALVRAAPAVPPAWTGRVEVAAADLGAAAPLEAALAGVECVVHLAAATRGTAAQQRAATVEGTARLLDAMTRTAARRIVLASSFAAYDWGSIDGTADESSPLLDPRALPASGPYAAAKWEQERLTRAASAQSGFDLTVLRPGFVWGRGHELPDGVGLTLGRVLLVLGPRFRPALAYVENCADLFAAVVADPRARGRTFNVVDGHGVSSWRHAAECRRVAGAPAIRLPVPYSLAWAGVRIAHALLRPLQPRLPSALVPPRFRARFRAAAAEPRAAREVLRWTPPWSYDEALRRALGPAA